MKTETTLNLFQFTLSKLKEPVCLMDHAGMVVQNNQAFRNIGANGVPQTSATHMDDFHWLDIRGLPVHWQSMFRDCKDVSHLSQRLGVRQYGKVKYFHTEAHCYLHNVQELLLLLVKPPTPEEYADEVDEAQLMRVMERLPMMICGWDDLSNICFWNAECERLTGHAKHEIVRNPDGMALLYPNADERKCILDRWAGWQQQGLGRIRDWELEVACKDGGKRVVAWTIQHKEESFMGLHTWGVGVDVTDHVNTRKALEHSEKRFSTISKATNDAVWDWDLVANELFWNDGMTNLFGHPKNEIEGNIHWWEGKIHPEDRQRVASRIQDFVDRGEESWWDEYRFCRLDGSYASVYDKGHIIKDETGKAIRMIGGIQDITDRKIFEQNLILKNTQIAEYVFHNSHRVRAPLARLLGLAFLLNDEHPDIGESKEMIEKIKTAADEIDRMTRHVSNMML